MFLPLNGNRSSFRIIIGIFLLTDADPKLWFVRYKIDDEIHPIVDHCFPYCDTMFFFRPWIAFYHLSFHIFLFLLI